MLELERLTKVYPGSGAPAVNDLSLSVREGEFIVLLGGSGCGKTTTLKMINRLIEPTSGRITIAGDDVTTMDPVALRRRIGYVFQGIGLFPHMSISANIGVTPRLMRWSAADIDSRVDELLELVGLPPNEYRDRAPSELSGGQRQRVGVARAIASKPRILLADEPFGALDPLTRMGLQDELLALRDALNLTIVLVTHDMTEAVLLADRIVVMDEGRLVQCDTPAHLMRAPANDTVRRLMEAPKRQADRVEDIAGAGSNP
jgi:osmoprotectant transport system ATP-binding protein